VAYVASGSACTEPNSQTPMSPGAIAAQNARVARMGRRFVAGNVALNTLVQTLGGVGIGDNVPGVTELSQAADFRNSPGCDSSILGDGSLYGGRIANGSQGPGLDEGGAFLPVSMGGNVVGSSATPGTPAAWTPATDAGASAAAQAAMPGVAPGASPSSSPGSAMGPGGPGGIPWRWNARGTGRQCPPEILPMMTIFPIQAWPTRGPIPPAGTAPPPVPAAPGGRSGPGSNAPPAPVASPGAAPTTGNVCLDLSLDYVVQSQVDPRQLLTCAQAGYSGVKGGPLLTQQYLLWRAANWNALPKVAYNPNPPQATPALLKANGLGQYDDGGSCMCLVVIALATAAGVWWAYEESRGR
jgi:hypothetical protein